MTAVDLDQLDAGAQYEVQVMAIVQNREGSPVSVRITTRESHFSYRFQLLSQVHNKLRKLGYINKLMSTTVIFSLYSWCCHPLAPVILHSFTGGRGYPEFCAACLESLTGCHRVHSAMG